MLDLTKLINTHYSSLFLEDKIEKLFEIFIKEDTDCVVIFEKDLKPVGIITLRDLPKIFNLPHTPKNLKELLETLNKKDLIVIFEDEDVFKAFQMMQYNNITHLLVMNKSFNLKGVICLKRLIKIFPEVFFIDPLTGLQGRIYLNLIETKLKDFQGKTCFIMADLDNFKQINDRYGHVFGDKVLVRVAQVLRKNVKITDDVIRYGGEEFLIILYRCNLQNAKKVAERLRKKIEEINFEEIPEVKITASFGISEFLGSKEIKEVIEEADKALYMAKKKGKNRVEVFKADENFVEILRNEIINL